MQLAGSPQRIRVCRQKLRSSVRERLQRTFEVCHHANRGGQSARFGGDSGTILRSDSGGDSVLRIAILPESCRIAEAPPEELLPSRIAILSVTILHPPCFRHVTPLRLCLATQNKYTFDKF